MRQVFYFFIVLLSFYHPSEAEGKGEILPDNNRQADSTQIISTIDRAARVKYQNIDSSIRMLNWSLAASEQMHLDCGIARALITLGYTYNVLGKLSESENYFNRALPYCKKCTEDKTLLPRLYMDAARCYTNQGNFQKATSYLNEAIRIITQENLSDVMAGKLAFSLGLFCFSLNQYDNALAFYQQSIASAQIQKDTTIYILSVINLGETYSAKEDWGKAIYYLRFGVSLAALNRYPVCQQEALKYLGDIYSRQGYQKQAINYYKQAIAVLNNQDSNTHLHLLSYYSLASAYFKIGNYEEAKEILYPLVEKARKLSIYNDLDIGLLLLGKININEGNYKEATKWMQAYIEFKNKLLDKGNLDNVNKLELQYLTSEKDKQIAQKQLQLSQKEIELKNKNIWIGSTSSVLIILTILFASFYRINKHKGKIDQLKATIDGEEHERVRIARELHDGVMVQFSAVKMNLSTLINKYSYVTDIEEFEKTLEQLDEATKELRRTAHNLMPDMLLEEGLSEALYYFCKNLQQITGLNIDFQLYGDIPRFSPDFELTVYRIIQELVHNIIKHAAATQALIQISCQDKLLMITVEDNGIGITEHDLRYNNGAGIKNIRSRIKALKGDMEIKGAIYKGTIINIEFDISKLKNKNTTKP